MSLNDSGVACTFAAVERQCLFARQTKSARACGGQAALGMISEGAVEHLASYWC